jgi:hypothetical protein
VEPIGTGFEAKTGLKEKGTASRRPMLFQFLMEIEFPGKKNGQKGAGRE